MWNADKSLLLSIISVRIFTIIGAVFLFGGVPIAHAYVDYIHLPQAYTTVLITGYLSLFAAFFIFYDLLKLLKNIRNDHVFCEDNIRCLRHISWLCMGVGVITAIASVRFITFILVAIAFAFIALIIRVVKNVMAQAVLIKAENDFTI